MSPGPTASFPAGKPLELLFQVGADPLGVRRSHRFALSFVLQFQGLRLRKLQHCPEAGTKSLDSQIGRKLHDSNFERKKTQLCFKVSSLSLVTLLQQEQSENSTEDHSTSIILKRLQKSMHSTPFGAENQCTLRRLARKNQCTLRRRVRKINALYAVGHGKINALYAVGRGKSMHSTPFWRGKINALYGRLARKINALYAVWRGKFNALYAVGRGKSMHSTPSGAENQCTLTAVWHGKSMHSTPFGAGKSMQLYAVECIDFGGCEYIRYRSQPVVLKTTKINALYAVECIDFGGFEIHPISVSAGCLEDNQKSMHSTPSSALIFRGFQYVRFNLESIDFYIGTPT